MNTPTPRTDAVVREEWIPPVTDCVPADFARQLERELAEANSEREMLIVERDEWKQLAEKLAYGI
jgi:hypothetical protein